MCVDYNNGLSFAFALILIFQLGALPVDWREGGELYVTRVLIPLVLSL